MKKLTVAARSIIFIALMALFCPAHATDDWLVGYWEGHLGSGQIAEARIRSVNPDGSFQFSWIRRQDRLSGGIREGKRTGSEVALRFAYGSNVFALADLRRTSDGKLVGTLTPTGKSPLPLTLIRISSNWDYATDVRGCDYRIFSGRYADYGHPIGTRHIDEGQKETRLNTKTWMVCSHGVLVPE